MSHDRFGTVAIVGQAPRAFRLDQRDLDGIWAINGPRVPDGWTTLFQLHGMDHIYAKHVSEDDDVWHLMSVQAREPGRRLIMPAAPDHPDLKHAEPYPLEAIMEGVGMGDAAPRRYFTGSFAMAVALAIQEGYAEIVIDGIMFGQDTLQWGASEGWAVPCLEYWIGRAESLGIQVEVPPGCGLFRNDGFVYGLEGPGSV